MTKELKPLKPKRFYVFMCVECKRDGASTSMNETIADGFNHSMVQGHAVTYWEEMRETLRK